MLVLSILASMLIALTGLSGLFVAASLLPLIRTDAWWVRIFDFPRAQIAAAGLILIGWASWMPPSSWRLGLLVLLTVCLGLQLLHIVPYTPLFPRQVTATRSSAAPRLSLLIANVLMTNRASDRLLALVRRLDPDVVFLVEPDAEWAEALTPLHAAYPHRVSRPQPNTYGMLLYSRAPLTRTEVCHLIEPDVPSVHTTLALPDGPEIDLIGLHPRPPRPDKAQDATNRDAELLIVARRLRHPGRPTLVVGDLNDVAWSHTTRLFQRISGLLDPRRGRGLFSTFPVAMPLLRYPLDHVFFSPHFRLVRLERLPDVGSDHFPIFAEVAYEPEAQAVHDAPTADASDLQESRRRIRWAIGPSSA